MRGVETEILYDTSMYPHRIRLRGPWEAEPLDPPGPPRRVTLPARLGECGLGDCRRVRFTRRFGRPRKLESFERVWLIGEGLPGRGTLALNGTALGGAQDAPFEFPVSPLLDERNELTVDLEAAAGGEWSDVALEVRCTAYLTDVRAGPGTDGRLRVQGRVQGEADGPMDLYVLVGGRSAAYAKCLADTTFDLETHEPVERGEVRVELVSGPVVWYVVEMDV